MNTRIIHTFALGLLLSTGGCSDGIGPLPESAPKGEICIQTRADESGSYRLLAFKADDNACALNQVVKADGTAQTISLAAGSYKFVSLVGAEPFDLPDAGTTGGLSLSKPITLKPGATLSPVGFCPAADITIPAASIYAPELQPLTCKVTLKIEDGEMLSPGNSFSYSLKNMHNGFSPDGKLPATTLTSGYNLTVEAVNYCLPTDGNAVIAYKAGVGGEQELQLKEAFKSGKSYTVTLTYKEDFSLKATIESWDQSVDNIHDADAVQP